MCFCLVYFFCRVAAQYISLFFLYFYRFLNFFLFVEVGGGGWLRYLLCRFGITSWRRRGCAGRRLVTCSSRAARPRSPGCCPYRRPGSGRCSWTRCRWRRRTEEGSRCCSRLHLCYGEENKTVTTKTNNKQTRDKTGGQGVRVQIENIWHPCIVHALIQSDARGR